MLCVVLQHGVFHFIVSIFLLHLTFAAETAVFLVACLAFLASFAALLVHRKIGSYPCLPLIFPCLSTVRASQDQDGMYSCRFLLYIHYPLGRFLQRQQNCV